MLIFSGLNVKIKLSAEISFISKISIVYIPDGALLHQKDSRRPVFVAAIFFLSKNDTLSLLIFLTTVHFLWLTFLGILENFIFYNFLNIIL